MQSFLRSLLPEGERVLSLAGRPWGHSLAELTVLFSMRLVTAGDFSVP